MYQQTSKNFACTNIHISIYKRIWRTMKKISKTVKLKSSKINA